MKVLAKCSYGFVLGWLIYMTAMVVTVYDGVPSLIFQPIIAAFFSGFFVIAALVSGLVLRVPKIKEAWSSAGAWVLLVTGTALLVMIFSGPLGLQTEFVDPETMDRIKSMSPAAFFVCYFLAVFPVVNFPGSEKLIGAPQGQ